MSGLQNFLQLQLGRTELAAGPAGVLAECRKIRKRFCAELGVEGTSFTLFYELNALVALGSYATAWRQLLRMERSLRNRRLDASIGPWSPEECWRGLHFYAPLLYLQGRYAEARQIMERGLHPWFDGSRRRTKNLFLYIGNRDPRPTLRQRVTLLHIYQALGESLESWIHWPEFVRTVPIDVLRNACLSRRELRENPLRIAQLRYHANA